MQAQAGDARLRGTQEPRRLRPRLGLKKGHLTTRYRVRRDTSSVAGTGAIVAPGWRYPEPSAPRRCVPVYLIGTACSLTYSSTAERLAPPPMWWKASAYPTPCLWPK